MAEFEVLVNERAASNDDLLSQYDLKSPSADSLITKLRLSRLHKLDPSFLGLNLKDRAILEAIGRTKRILRSEILEKGESKILVDNRRNLSIRLIRNICTRQGIGELGRRFEESVAEDKISIYDPRGKNSAIDIAQEILSSMKLGKGMRKFIPTPWRSGPRESHYPLLLHLMENVIPDLKQRIKPIDNPPALGTRK